jgi:hypothetical protein
MWKGNYHETSSKTPNREGNRLSIIIIIIYHLKTDDQKIIFLPEMTSSGIFHYN